MPDKPDTYIGKTIERSYHFDKHRLYFYCEVLDQKRQYGHLRILVRPVAGGGEMWIDAEHAVVSEGARQ